MRDQLVLQKCAMKDYHKAKVYGSKTFGKGIVQTTREFSDGSLIKYTEMKWLTPDGHYIHGKGIRPDVSISTPKIPITQCHSR